MPPAGASSSLLQRLLTAAGWDVEEVPGGWRARRPDRPTGILYFEGHVPAGFQRSFPSTEGPTTILLGEAPTAHDRDRMELTGAMVVEPEEVAEVVLDLVRASPVPVRPSPEGPSGPVRPHQSEATASSLSRKEEAPAHATEGTITPPGGSEAAFPADPTPFTPEVFERDRIVRPRLRQADLVHMAAARWRGGSPRLLLVPFFLFAYELPEDPEGADAPPRLVAVPASGGAPQFWPPGEREIIDALSEPHVRLRPSLRPEAARLLALQSVAEHHAHSEERAEQLRSMLVIEHHRRHRTAEEIRIGPPALVWVPHWVVEAWNGREVLDAVTGLASAIPLEGDELPP